MFHWKSAVVLIGIVILTYPLALGLARANWERVLTFKLALCAAVIACVTVSFFSIILSEILFAGLLLMCIDRRAPIVGIYIFFLLWTPSAAGHLKIGSAYFVPLTPMLAFAFALAAAYLLHPRLQLKTRFSSSDFYLLTFLGCFWICISLRDTIIVLGRNFFTYFFPYAVGYFVVSRTRIERPELALRFFVYGALLAGAMCLFESIRHWPLYSGLPSLKGVWTLQEYHDAMMIRGGVFRSYGPFVHPLPGSVVLGMALVAVAGLLHLRGAQPHLLAIGALILLGMLVMVSRSGVVTLAVGLVALQALRRRYASVAAILVLAAIGFVGLRIMSGSDGASTAAYRMFLLFGIPKVLGSHLILGYREAVDLGLLDAFIQGEGLIDLVNVYLSIAVIGGLVSLVPYLFFLFSSVTQYRRLRRARPSSEQLIAAQTCLAMQAGYVVAAAFLGAWGTPMMVSMLCTALLVAIRTEAERAPARAAARARAPERPAEAFALPTLP